MLESQPESLENIAISPPALPSHKPYEGSILVYPGTLAGEEYQSLNPLGQLLRDAIRKVHYALNGQQPTCHPELVDQLSHCIDLQNRFRKSALKVQQNAFGKVLSKEEFAALSKPALQRYYEALEQERDTERDAGAAAGLEQEHLQGWRRAVHYSRGLHASHGLSSIQDMVSLAFSKLEYVFHGSYEDQLSSQLYAQSFADSFDRSALLTQTGVWGSTFSSPLELWTQIQPDQDTLGMSSVDQRAESKRRSKRDQFFRRMNALQDQFASEITF
ncbi:uncharacterized protein BJ171DRAFT_282397 [Polychytrium aggregatum]|uniref:uncharacterized protein n=1 Tax=Polychytrium aggregatum TaxID=110093 RepID=UPI0022FF3453|nr:uncharacterized protein BJ171DRAFT_282397 [Polychytrium aggregatum]KAI9193268.1 hypothetical protein BJ171DRAFT_282397 [Polychytrium aggregatum]